MYFFYLSLNKSNFVSFLELKCGVNLSEMRWIIWPRQHDGIFLDYLQALLFYTLLKENTQTPNTKMVPVHNFRLKILYNGACAGIEMCINVWLGKDQIVQNDLAITTEQSSS